MLVTPKQEHRTDGQCVPFNAAMSLSLSKCTCFTRLFGIVAPRVSLLLELLFEPPLAIRPLLLIITHNYVANACVCRIHMATQSGPYVTHIRRTHSFRIHRKAFAARPIVDPLWIHCEHPEMLSEYETELPGSHPGSEPASVYSKKFA